MAEPYVVCDRCGFKYRRSQLRKEWTGLMVCPKDWDPKPAELRPPPVGPEGLPVRDARPEPPIIERPEGELGGDDL
jgi:hypothetical protein